MVWNKLDKNGKRWYIKGSGNFFYLSPSKKGSLQNIPDGWDVIIKKNGGLKLIKVV